MIHKTTHFLLPLFSSPLYWKQRCLLYIPEPTLSLLSIKMLLNQLCKIIPKFWDHFQVQQVNKSREKPHNLSFTWHDRGALRLWQLWWRGQQEGWGGGGNQREKRNQEHRVGLWTSGWESCFRSRRRCHGSARPGVNCMLRTWKACTDWLLAQVHPPISGPCRWEPRSTTPRPPPSFLQAAFKR